MSPPEAFPLYFPRDARRAFENDDAVRRFATVARLGHGSRVLELAAGRGVAAILLAKEYGCEVVAADADDDAVSTLNDRIRAYGLSDRVQVKKVDYAKLPFGEGEFDGILVHQVLAPLAGATGTLRRMLVPSGRLSLVYPAKVGRFPAQPVVDHWEARLGEPLLLPRELLGVMQRAGFEPETVETLSDAELAELYRGCEGKLGDARAAPLKAEIDQFRSQGRASVTYALALGRRKEPGEKPPASRDRG